MNRRNFLKAIGAALAVAGTLRLATAELVLEEMSVWYGVDLAKGRDYTIIGPIRFHADELFLPGDHKRQYWTVA